MLISTSYSKEIYKFMDVPAFPSPLFKFSLLKKPRRKGYAKNCTQYCNKDC